jgi:signal transduction histidine kinase
MIGAIAHDLRTPLARIAFRIEAAPDDVREKVQADIEQMRAMIAATIGFVRGTGAGERTPVDLVALLASIAEQDREFGRHIEFRGAGPALILGEAVALERLFQNLIDNAIAYAGPVDIRVTAEDDRPW